MNIAKYGTEQTEHILSTEYSNYLLINNNLEISN